MYEDIDKAAGELRNQEAGWVTRRDAAETLGQAAARALTALEAHKEDPDRDVQGAVQKELGKAGGALAGVKPEGGYTLEELVRACEKPGKRTVKPEGDGFVVEVKLKGDRRQLVNVQPYERRDGAKLIRVFTYCGKPSDDALHWALRANMKLNQGAFALADMEGEEQFVLMNCYLEGEATPREIKASIKELSFYGDWIEQKLSGLDDF